MARPCLPSIKAGRWLVGLPGLAAFLYLCLCAWFWAHQRNFQYTLGGTNVAPAAVGLANVAAVNIVTEDGERIVGWWKPKATRTRLNKTSSEFLPTVNA